MISSWFFINHGFLVYTLVILGFSPLSNSFGQIFTHMYKKSTIKLHIPCYRIHEVLHVRNFNDAEVSISAQETDMIATNSLRILSVASTSTVNDVVNITDATIKHAITPTELIGSSLVGSIMSMLFTHDIYIVLSSSIASALTAVFSDNNFSRRLRNVGSSTYDLVLELVVPVISFFDSRQQSQLAKDNVECSNNTSSLSLSDRIQRLQKLMEFIEEERKEIIKLAAQVNESRMPEDSFFSYRNSGDYEQPTQIDVVVESKMLDENYEGKEIVYQKPSISQEVPIAPLQPLFSIDVATLHRDNSGFSKPENNTSLLLADYNLPVSDLVPMSSVQIIKSSVSANFTIGNITSPIGIKEALAHSSTPEYKFLSEHIHRHTSSHNDPPRSPLTQSTFSMRAQAILLNHEQVVMEKIHQLEPIEARLVEEYLVLHPTNKSNSITLSDSNQTLPTSNNSLSQPTSTIPPSKIMEERKKIDWGALHKSGSDLYSRLQQTSNPSIRPDNKIGQAQNQKYLKKRLDGPLSKVSNPSPLNAPVTNRKDTQK